MDMTDAPAHPEKTPPEALNRVYTGTVAALKSTMPQGSKPDRWLVPVQVLSSPGNPSLFLPGLSLYHLWTPSLGLCTLGLAGPELVL